jgi:hypothetical protein
VTFSVRVRQYRGLTPPQGIGIVGQPQPHYYFHRPLQTLPGTCFAAGMMLDGLEEPAFTTSSANPHRAGTITGRFRRSWQPGCVCPARRFR